MRDAKTARRFVSYAAVGAVGTGAQYGVLVGLVAMGLATPVVGSMIGAAVGAVVNYSLNRRVTFRSPTVRHAMAAPRFAVIALLGVLVNGVLMKVLTDGLGVNYLVAQVIATGCVLGLTFGLNSAWTFRDIDGSPGVVRR